MRACPRKGEVIGEGNLRTSHGFSILEKLHSCINALIERWFPSPKDLHVLTPKRFLNASFACRMFPRTLRKPLYLKASFSPVSAMPTKRAPNPAKAEAFYSCTHFRYFLSEILHSCVLRIHLSFVLVVSTQSVRTKCFLLENIK